MANPVNPAKFITSGKTKSIWSTDRISENGNRIVEFCPKGVLISTTGSGVIELAAKEKLKLEKLKTQQNHHMFSFLNKMGVETTYVGMKQGSDVIMEHEECTPLSIEFVNRFGMCNRSSSILREPEKFAAFEKDGTYSTTKAREDYLDENNRVIPFAEHAIVKEAFHKKYIIEKEDGTLGMVSEQSIIDDPRYFALNKKGKKEPTEFAHEDPLLVTKEGLQHIWYVYDQKKPLKTQKPLAIINRENGEVYDMNGRIMGTLPRSSRITREMEHMIQDKVSNALDMISVACLLTDFGTSKTEKALNNAFVIDGKLEVGMTKDGKVKITDDLEIGNMRWAFDRVSSMTAKGLYQNFDDETQAMMIAETAVAGTKYWTHPLFLSAVQKFLPAYKQARKKSEKKTIELISVMARFGKDLKSGIDSSYNRNGNGREE